MTRRKTPPPAAAQRRGDAPGTRPWRDPIFLALFAAALALRLVYLWQSSANPVFTTPIFDAFNYHRAALYLADRNQVPRLLFWQSPFYPVFLAVVYRVTHDSVLAARLIQACLGALLAALTYRLGTRCFGRTAGTIAGAFVALYGPLIFFETELLGAGWTAIWCVALTLALLRAEISWSVRFGGILGVIGALGVLTHATILPFLAGGCLWLAVVWRRQDLAWRTIAGRAVVVAAGFLAVALPVAAASRHYTSSFSFLPSGGGINLWLGNNPRSAETDSMRPWGEYTRLRALAARAEARGQTEESRYFTDRTLSYMASQPFDYARGLVRKGLEFACSREISSYEDVYLFRRWSGLLGVLVWKVGRFGFPFGVLLPLAVAGVALARRRVPTPLLLLVVVLPLLVISVHVNARYRIPVVPALAVLAGAGCVGFADVLRAKRWRRLAAAAALAGATVLAASVPGPFHAEGLNTEAELYVSMAMWRLDHGEAAEAAELCKKALDLRPGWPDGLYQLAVAQRRQGRLEEAIQGYRALLQAQPDYFEAESALGEALLGLGKTAEAEGHYRAALRLNPNFPAPYAGLAATLVKQGKLGPAIQELREAIAIEPADPRLHYNLALALAKDGQLPEAVAEYRWAVGIDPGVAPPAAAREWEAIARRVEGR